MNNTILKITVFLLSFLFASTAVAQHEKLPPQADSIIALLPHVEGKEKLASIVDLTTIIYNYPVVKYYFQMAIEEARLQNHADTEAWALGALANYYYSQFDNDSLFILGNEAIRFARQHKLYDRAFYVINNFIRRYQAEGNTLSALRTAEEAYEEAKKLELNDELSEILSTIGDIYYNIEQYENAERFYIKSIEAADKNLQNNNVFFIRQYYNLSYTARYMHRPHEQLRYTDSLQVEIERFCKVNPLYNVQLFKYYVELLNAIGYAEINQPAQSLQAIRRAEAIYDPQWGERNKTYAVMPDDMYGAYYFAAGNYDKSIEHLTLLWNYYKKINLETSCRFIEKKIADAYFAKGDKNTAVEMYRNLMHRKDSLNQEMFYSQINEFRTIYELDKAELENHKQFATIQKLQFTVTILIISGVALILIVALVIWNRNRIVQKNRGLYRQIKEQDRLADELEQLRNYTEKQNFTYSQPAEDMQETVLQQQTSADNSKVIPLPASNDEKRQQKVLISRLNEYLYRNRNFANPELSINKMSEELKISRTYMFQAIKETYGKPLQEYINSLRLNEARRMLDSTNELIETIAKMCGYNITSTFYRQFRKQYNISPAEYRKIHKQLRSA